MTTLTKVDTSCTALSLIPTVNGSTVRSFSTHGHQSAAKGSLTTVSRFDIRLIQHFDSSALWFDGPEVALIGYFPILYYPPPPLVGGGAASDVTENCESGNGPGCDIFDGQCLGTARAV
jgi:hypothetical protein